MLGSVLPISVSIVEWGLRDMVLRGLTLFGAVTVLLTELLSPFHLLRRGPLAVAWLLIALVAAARISSRRPTLPRIRVRPMEAAIVLAIACIVAIVGVTAVLSPPTHAAASPASARIVTVTTTLTRSPGLTP